MNHLHNTPKISYIVLVFASYAESGIPELGAVGGIIVILQLRVSATPYRGHLYRADLHLAMYSRTSQA